MNQTFWQRLQKKAAIIGLSPMDGVTDAAYRFIQKKYGHPDLIYTEFTSVEGVCHRATRLLKDFLFDESERPIVAQIYGTTPDFFRQTAILLCELGFDGIDINMGCPAKNVEHSGAGAALIKTPELALEIIAATKLGVEQWQNTSNLSKAALPNIDKKILQVVTDRHRKLTSEYQKKRIVPVSVKTRIGYNSIVIEDWTKTLAAGKPAAIAVHGRTLKQHYAGAANWDAIGRAASILHHENPEILILGNGDIKNREHALQLSKTYSFDGALIGRASFGNPFVFRDQNYQPPISKFRLALEHATKFEELFGSDEKYSFLPMRKHLGWYVNSIPRAKQLRIALFQANSAAEVEKIFASEKLI